MFDINITNHEAEARTCTLCFRSVDGVQLLPGTIDLEVVWKHEHHLSGGGNLPEAVYYPRTSHRGGCYLEWCTSR